MGLECCPCPPRERIVSKVRTTDITDWLSLSWLIWKVFLQIFWPRGPWWSVPFWKISISPVRRSGLGRAGVAWSAEPAGRWRPKPARWRLGRLTDTRRLEVSLISPADICLLLTVGRRNCLNLSHLSLRAKARHFLQTYKNSNHYWSGLEFGHAKTHRQGRNQ